ncbi:MAG: hypothetical protein ACRCZ9_00650 [Fusobacteriaceae bacterium]
MSDQGLQFISKEFNNVCELYNITHKYATIFYPTGNSVVERIHTTLGNSIRCGDEGDLKKLVDKIKRAMQLSYSRAIKCSPYEYVFNTSPFNHLQNYKNLREYNIKKCKIKNIFENVSKFEVGDKVLCKKFIRRKFDPHYEGPFTILNSSNTVYPIDKGFCEVWINQRYQLQWRGGKCCVQPPLDENKEGLTKNKNIYGKYFLENCNFSRKKKYKRKSNDKGWGDTKGIT